MLPGVEKDAQQVHRKHSGHIEFTKHRHALYRHIPGEPALFPNGCRDVTASFRKTIGKVPQGIINLPVLDILLLATARHSLAKSFQTLFFS